MVIKTGILVFWALAGFCGVFAQVEPLHVKYNFYVDDGDKAGSQVTVERDGVLWKQRDGGDAKNYFDLEYQHEFVMTFAKPGFITKKIAISTVVPRKKLEEPFEPLTFSVTIFKQYEGVDIIVFNQPVARYAYNVKKEGFEYDTDYTKTILSQVKKAEDELKLKRREEKSAAGKEPVKATGVEKKTPVVQQLPAEQKKAVEQKKPAVQKRPVEKKAEAVLKKSSPNIIADMGKGSLLFGDVMADNHIEREYVEGNKHVTETTVIKGGRSYVYKKVVYAWGVYYFRDNVSITEPTYNQDVL